ncbi:hypothetical protein CR513_14224, partial [Mucuna pruriens]
MAFSEYDIIYVNQKATKGSALAEHLAYHPLEWTMWFDEASNLLGNGIGVVLASPRNQCFPFLAKLGFSCTNNMAECEACTMGLMMALEHQVKQLKVFGDLALVIYQLRR